MEIKPNYYDSFKCIAGKCKHNCCIGWEIDIDEDTIKKYRNETGILKEKLQKNISFEPCAHFELNEYDRCPFLNNENLCELILNKGKDMLCEICKEHPRFYNFVYDVTETGIGLCCEEAARLILTNPDKVHLITDEKEIVKNDFYCQRDEIFSILQNREKPLTERISYILEYTGVCSPVELTNWQLVYKGIEHLDPTWENHLKNLNSIETDIPQILELPCEQLIWYFIYRHLSGALEDFLFAERVQFAILSCYVIISLNKSKSLSEMLEIARMYSAEIEYSDENVNALLDKLNECNCCS